MQLNDKITATLAHIARQYPDFTDWLANERQKDLELLEGTNSDVVRGGCLKLKELLSALKHSESR